MVLKIKLLSGTVIKQTAITATPKPNAASIFFEIAIKVHMPKKTDKAMFSIKTVVIKILR
jgi:hypothetical protein